MNEETLNLAFAREVAGLDPDQDCLYGNGRRIYENWREIIDHKGREVIDHEGVPACACGWTGKSWHNTGHKKALPDYTKDWNAVIAQIENRGFKWGRTLAGMSWCIVGTDGGYVRGECMGSDCAALARAVLDCVRAMKVGVLGSSGPQTSGAQTSGP